MPKDYIWKAQGDADHYCILQHLPDAKVGWVAAVHLNGELTKHQQEALMGTMVDALEMME